MELPFFVCGENIQDLHSRQLSSVWYNIMNYSHCGVHQTFKTYSSSSWKFVPFDQHVPIPATLGVVLKWQTEPLTFLTGAW